MVASATIPNSDIVLRRSGHGDNAVVFVHGFLDDQYAWNPVLADLSAPAFETIQFDQAGFGDRAEPSGPITSTSSPATWLLLSMQSTSHSCSSATAWRRQSSSWSRRHALHERWAWCL